MDVYEVHNNIAGKENAQNFSTNCMHGRRLKRQTNSNAITIDGQKPILDNSIDKDWITYSAPDIISTNINLP